MTAIWTHIHRVRQCLLVNDQRLHLLLTNLDSHSTSNRALERARASTAKALLCYPRTLGQDYHGCCRSLGGCCKFHIVWNFNCHSHFFQVDVLECFPVIYPVTLVGMNWISVVTVVLLLFTLLLWLMSKRHVFTGPRIDMQKMRLRREEALGIATGGEVMETNNLILRREKV